MSTATEVALRVSWRVRDDGQDEVDAAGYLAFLNDAVEDLAAAGWVLPLAEDTATQVASTYEYTVPDDFVYVKEIRLEHATTAGLYDTLVPYWAWTMAYVSGSTPKVRLNSRYFSPTADKKVLFVGQKRQSALAGGGTVPPGILPVIRDRAVSYAAAHLAQGASELGRWRQQLAEFYWKTTENTMLTAPEEYRIAPGSVGVPGR